MGEGSVRTIGIVLLLSVGLGCVRPQAGQKAGLPYQDVNVQTGPLSDGSLWQDAQTTSDQRARRVNDLVTIRIAETTTGTLKADVATSRVGSNSLKATSELSKLTPLKDGTAATSNIGDQFKGAGSTDRSSSLATTITARVVKVLGNGNLIFEGFRDLQMNNETQRLYVAGMVNPLFLDVNDSVASNQVAELRMAYGGRGVVDETTKPGYVSRLLNFVWPY
jgi:flagellar L-ring protein precursor FlgH